MYMGLVPTRRGASVMAAAAWLAGACGDPVGVGPDAGVDAAADAASVSNDIHRSGRRLKISYLESAEGTRQFWELFDRELQQPCWYTYTAAGLRCVPPNTWVSVYGDADCTRPLVTWFPVSCGQVPDLVAEDERTECTSQLTRVFRRGARLAPRVVYHRRYDDGSCEATEPSPDADYYATGDEIPLTAFVAGTPRRGAGATRLVQEVLEGDDGSQVEWGLHDQALDTDCHPYVPSLISNGFDSDEKDLTCVPPTAQARFSDTSCTEPVAAWFGCGAARYVEAIDFTTCPPTMTYHETADEIELTTVYGGQTLDGNDVCRSSVLEPRDTCYRVGAEVPLDTFVHLRRLRDTTVVGRLQPYHDVADDGFRRRSEDFYDTVLGVSCQVDGFAAEPRCHPVGEASALTELFRDPDCAEPIAVGEQRLERCPTPPARFATEPADGTCTFMSPAYRLGDELPATTVLYERSSGDCRPFARDTAHARYYSVVEVIPPSRFAVLQHRIED